MMSATEALLPLNTSNIASLVPGAVPKAMAATLVPWAAVVDWPG